MKQLENRFNDEIRIAIYPKGIVERIKLLFCNRILVSVDLTTFSDNGFIEVDKQLMTR